MIDPRIIGAAILAAILFGSGWQVRTWYDGARDASRLEAEAKAKEQMAELANTISEKTEKSIQGIRIENRSIYNEVQKEVQHDVVYRDCVLPDAGLQLINKARSGSASGKPDDQVPRPAPAR